MSRQLALDAINLRPTPRYAHTEYSLAYHKDYVRSRTGLPEGHEQMVKLYDMWGIDFNWGTNEGLNGDWASRGRATDMGHAVYAADGSDLRQPKVCPFKTVEEVWAFDPIAEYGLPDFAEQVAAYEKMVQDNRVAWPGQLTTGGYYKSTISGCIQAFGWDMFLLACTDRAKLEPLLDRFAAFTMHHMRAWAETSAEAIIQHDDFVWTEGAFMNPDIYRKVIIPNFAEMWKPLHAAGKKVLFISDGNYMEFAEDIAEAGADGFFFEPMH
ncbi:MAG: uroporphyrinogen decarboxylase family protein, partial [Armatimonadia bacterium]